ncbi:vacuolar ATP synthase subunit S1-domain-containing protein [Rhodofomes roseus]|uniref:Protein BIG1 n=1 Tax=Rhodofomes roseus TaxID=34475 RepID=A0ABQ8KY13_9APHY|nr:vacuolar ATP synthase subunit S1-domain-containing protein [Rhodofomes roseus]KAH9843651.1 vacuolar ATP synthase subunit S1-domain-containing protein [Rhodofomes roseus]
MARSALYFLLTLLPAASYAYSGTAPIVAWSSHSSNALSLASSAGYTNSVTALEDILLNGAACQHDAIILVDQKGLHASDLRNLPSSSELAQTLNSAVSTLELPYVPRSVSNPFSNLAGAVAERCGARVVTHAPGSTDSSFSAKEKHVVCVEMPALEGVEGADRRKVVAEHDSSLSSAIATLAETFPSHLVVYAGWHPSLYARQSSPFASNLTSTAAFATPSGGILARYQLLTPGLILALAVGFFILVPIVLMGVSALASIQSPLQGEAPKGYIASEKKNQ